MYIYFDTNGTIKEIVNDKSIRNGSNEANKIYCYLEGEPEIDDIWYLQKLPSGELSNEVSFKNSTITKAIPYDAKRDMKYFKDFEQYTFYVFTLNTFLTSQKGLNIATIRVSVDNTIWALGELTFNVQENVINVDNGITQSQYDYLLLAYASRTLNEQTGSDLNDLIDDKLNAKIGDLASGSPKVFDTEYNIEHMQDDEGIAVATDTGYIYVWNDTQEQYISTGMLYLNDASNIVYHDGNQLKDGSDNDFYPNIADGCVTQEKLDNDLFDDLLLKETTDITSSFTLQNRYLDKANGNANPDANSRCTDFIDLSQYGEFFISGFAQYATCMICTYDENKTFLRSYGDGTSAGVTYTDYDFIPQSDEKYAKFGTYQYTTHPLIIKSVEVIGKAENKTPNYLYKKKYVACGDSFTKGDVIASNKVYPYLIAERNNMTLVNMSANGSYAHNGADGFTNSNNSYYYQNIPLDADYITIAYGLNETSTTIGTKDSTDNTTIWGAYNEILTWIITNIPNAKVGIISNDAWMTYELRNALQEIASYYGVSFLDLKEYGKPMMISGKYTEDGDVNSTIKNLRTNQYCVSNLNGHPNELGHRVRSYIIENFLRGMDATDNRYTKKEVETKLSAKQNTLTFDNTPTENSTNPVTSGGVYNAINGAKTYTDNAINDLRWELGSHTLDVTTDTDTKYLKSVPNYTIGCQINTLGGMSYKSENLFDYSSVTDNKFWSYALNTTSVGDLSGNSASDFISVLPNTQYTITTYISNAGVALVKYWKNTTTESTTGGLRAGTYITADGSKQSYSFTTPSDCNYITINCDTANKQNAMIVKGSTAPTTYKPYFSGIRESAVTSVVSRKVGLNSLRLTQIGAVDLGTLTWEYRSTEQKFKSQQISGMKSGGVVYCTKYAYDGNTGFDAQTMNNMTIRSHNASPLVYIKDTNYTNATTFKNSLNGVYLFYELATELATPQQAVIDNLVKDTLSINASIQNLTGYGWGVNSTCYNYIDFDSKKYIQKVGKYTFTGNENWSKAGQSYETSALDSVVKSLTSNSETINCLIIGFTPANANQVYGGAVENSISGIETGNANKIRIYSSAFESVADVQSALAGKTLYYELATPVETDISAYLTTDTIDVDGGGSLEFTNTYNNDVPSDIDYLIEEVKA